MFETLFAGVTLGLHLVSVHVPAESWQNNVNPGIYLKTSDGWTVGAFYNTLKRTAVYGGYTFERGPFAVTVGVTTGYRKVVTDTPNPNGWGPHTITERGYSSGAFTPMIAPSVALPKIGGVTPRLSFIPGIGAVKFSVLHLSVEEKF